MEVMVGSLANRSHKYWNNVLVWLPNLSTNVQCLWFTYYMKCVYVCLFMFCLCLFMQKDL